MKRRGTFARDLIGTIAVFFGLLVFTFVPDLRGVPPRELQGALNGCLLPLGRRTRCTRARPAGVTFSFVAIWAFGTLLLAAYYLYRAFVGR